MAGFIKISKEYLQRIVQGISPTEETIPPRSISAGGSATLKDTGTTPITFAIVAFQGDGDSAIRYDVAIGGSTYSLYADEIGIAVVVNATLKITAVNTDTTSARNTGTIVIARVT
jgi:hypothetical protein